MLYNSRFNVECQPEQDPTLPVSIWTYLPQSTLISHLDKFHNKHYPLNLLCLQEPDIFLSDNYSIDTSNWKHTEVNILHSFHNSALDSERFNIESPSSSLSPKRYFFPLFWLYHSFYEMYYNKTEYPMKFKYTPTLYFLSYNREPRPHRCALLDSLYKSNLLKYGEYSLLRKPSKNNGWDSEFLDFYYPSFDYSNFKVKNRTLDKPEQIDKTFFTFGEWYTKTSFQLVTETIDSVIWYTEKTFINILSGKPFLIYGAKDINKTLTEYGFKIFDNLFDYSFDNEDNPDKRIKLLTQEIKRVVNTYTPEQIHTKLLGRCSFNLQHANKILKEELFIPDIFKFWNSKFNNTKIWKLHTARWYYDFKQMKSILNTDKQEYYRSI